jgi:hypothetical protein
MNTSSKNCKTNVSSLSLTETKYYFLLSLFVIGNILLPAIFHQFHLGGNIFLPIFFFVLISGYKYGFKLSIPTAILSPSISFYLSGMPMLKILPLVIGKGILLAAIASIVGRKNNQTTLLNLLYIITSSQFLWFIISSIFYKNFNLAWNDFLISWPGLLLQLIGGFIILKMIVKFTSK